MQPGRNGRPGFEEPSIAGRPGQAGRPVVLNHPSFTSVVPMEKDLPAKTDGSGAIAPDQGVAAENLHPLVLHRAGKERDS